MHGMIVLERKEHVRLQPHLKNMEFVMLAASVESGPSQG